MKTMLHYKITAGLLIGLSLLLVACSEPIDEVLSDSIFIFEVNTRDATASVVGLADNYTSKNITIPSIFNTYTVTSIQKKAFKNKDLLSATIPNTIISIGDEAFSSNDLTEIIIPDSVESIGKEAFISNSLGSMSECLITPPPTTPITPSVVLGSNVSSIGNSAFKNNDLKCITIPSNVAVIEPSAFKSNEITILTFDPLSRISTIGSSSFLDNALETVTIPASVTTLGAGAFLNNRLTDVEMYSTTAPRLDNTHGSVFDIAIDTLHTLVGAKGYTGGEWDGFKNTAEDLVP